MAFKKAVVCIHCNSGYRFSRIPAILTERLSLRFSSSSSSEKEHSTAESLFSLLRGFVPWIFLACQALKWEHYSNDTQTLCMVDGVYRWLLLNGDPLGFEMDCSNYLPWSSQDGIALSACLIS